MKEHTATISPATTTYRVYYGDELIVESDDVLELRERYGDRVYPVVPYFAPSVAERLALEPSDSASTCPLKGVASYATLCGTKDAVWTYRDPKPAVEAIANYIGFDASKGFRVVGVE